MAKKLHPSPSQLLLLLLAAFALGSLFLLAGPSEAGAKKKRASIHLRGAAALGQGRAIERNGPCRRLRRARGKARRIGPMKRYRSVDRRLQECRNGKREQGAATSSDPVSLYWGASIGDQITGEQAPWDTNAISRFEGIVKKPLSMVHFMAPFANCESSPCSFYDFPEEEMEAIRRHGALPFFSWSSQSIPSDLDEPDFQLADVIAGTYDAYIREWASAAQQWGHPFFLRFNWEMNGNWFPWAEGVNGNTAGQYVAAWRHVHDIFAEVGATNVSWVWCPNVDPWHKLGDLASLYPGDPYVDWTGLDGYNWGTNPARPDEWRSFDELFDDTYHEIVDTIAPSKPMAIGEVGSSEYGGSKAAWISEMLGTLPTAYPRIRGLLWFEKFDDGMDWPVETSPASAAAFATGIQSPSYLGRTPLPAAGVIPPPA